MLEMNSQGHHQVSIRHRRGTPRYASIEGNKYARRGNSDLGTGKLTKNLSHLAVNFSHPKKDTIEIELHHGARKNVATLRTVRTLINNLIIGVTKGYKYKMRYVYAHFPINVNVDKNNETGLYEVEIRYVERFWGSAVCDGDLGLGLREMNLNEVLMENYRNFIGEKIVRKVIMHPGVEVITSVNQKDELQLSGNSLENVSQSAADIQQICRVRNKDIRKVRNNVPFLSHARMRNWNRRLIYCAPVLGRSVRVGEG